MKTLSAKVSSKKHKPIENRERYSKHGTVRGRFPWLKMKTEYGSVQPPQLVHGSSKRAFSTRYDEKGDEHRRRRDLENDCCLRKRRLNAFHPTARSTPRRKYHWTWARSAHLSVRIRDYLGHVPRRRAPDLRPTPMHNPVLFCLLPPLAIRDKKKRVYSRLLPNSPDIFAHVQPGMI